MKSNTLTRRIARRGFPPVALKDGHLDPADWWHAEAREAFVQCLLALDTEEREVESMCSSGRRYRLVVALDELIEGEPTDE